MLKFLKKFWRRFYYHQLGKVILNPNAKLKNVIVFESIPDVSDNTYAVFKEMLRRRLNQKCKLVWLLSRNAEMQYPKYKNVKYVWMHGVEGQYYNRVAKVKICCNDFLDKKNDKQVCVFLGHGTALKSVKKYYTIPKHIDYFVVASKNVQESQAYELSFDREKTIPLGSPRNDELVGCDIDARKLLQATCKKIIVWCPTFRQHKNGFKTGIKDALPIIHDSTMAEQLNEMAKKQDVLLVLKPHYAQDVRYVKDLGLSNIRFVDDGFFMQHKVSFYQFMSSCDALLTDYSSIYLDYTLCDKPVGVIWEDIEEYKKFPGVVSSFDAWLEGAEKLYTLEDLSAFIERISKGIDVLKSERAEIRDLVNISTDGKNSERVVDFIIEKASLKL